MARGRQRGGNAAGVDPLQHGAVLVRDGVVVAAERARIARFLTQPIWQYGWRSNPRRDRYPFWHVHFAGGDYKSRASCERELAAYQELRPIHGLWQRLKRGVLKGHVPLRVYANAHTYGVEGYVHTDNSESDYFSTLYYAHSRWDKNWAGETVFYDKSEEEIMASVYPRPGRVVSFHGATPHCARAPSRECAALRLTVVIKTRLAQ